MASPIVSNIAETDSPPTAMRERGDLETLGLSGPDINPTKVPGGQHRRIPLLAGGFKSCHGKHSNCVPSVIGDAKSCRVSSGLKPLLHQLSPLRRHLDKPAIDGPVWNTLCKPLKARYNSGARRMPPPQQKHGASCSAEDQDGQNKGPFHPGL